MIVPDEIDTVFLSQFKNLILDFVGRGFRFILIAGGGRTARRYQTAGNTVTPMTKDDMDWLGIHTTRLNAHLLRSVFVHIAHPRIITSPHDDIDWKESVLIGAGWRPGWSTDYVSVLISKNFAITKLINLSNIDYVYTRDPRKDPNATKIETISWSEFRKLIPSEWDPGLSSPFDPIAARESEKIGMEVVIMNGNNLENLRAYLEGEQFAGTRIIN